MNCKEKQFCSNINVFLNDFTGASAWTLHGRCTVLILLKSRLNRCGTDNLQCCSLSAQAEEIPHCLPIHTIQPDWAIDYEPAHTKMVVGLIPDCVLQFRNMLQIPGCGMHSSVALPHRVPQSLGAACVLKTPQFVFSLNDGRLLSLAVAGWVLARCETTCTASFEMSGRALIIWVFCLFITFLLTNTAASSPFARRLPLTRCVEEPVDGCKFSHFL